MIAIVLIVVFGIIWLRDRASGGYKAERITPEEVALYQADPGDSSAQAVLAAEAAGAGAHPAADSASAGAATAEEPADEGKSV